MRLSIIFVFAICVLHVADFLLLIVTNDRVSSYFTFRTEYVFNIDTAIFSFQIIILSIVSLLIGNFISLYRYKFGYYRFNQIGTNHFVPRLTFLMPLYIFSMVIVLYAFLLGVFSGNYGNSGFTSFRKANSFMFEIRFIPLIISYYIIINNKWFSKFWFRLSVFYLIIYFILVLLSGTRSLLIEVFPLFYIYVHRMSVGRFYAMLIVGFFLLLTIVNLLIYLRLGLSDKTMLFDNIFKVEYSKLLNNFYSTTLSTELDPGWLLMATSQKLIPSIIRDTLGIQNIWDLNATAEVLTKQLSGFGGGSSGLAEIYAYFGWFSFIIFALIGIYLGRLCQNIERAKPISLMHLGHLYLFTSLLLLLRNSFDIYIKNFLQVALVLFLMDVMTRFVFRSTGEVVNTADKR